MDKIYGFSENNIKSDDYVENNIELDSENKEDTDKY